MIKQGRLCRLTFKYIESISTSMNVNIDLNQDQPFLNLRSALNIKIVVKKKLNLREVLVQKFGEDGFNAIIASPEPLMLYRTTIEDICVFILV